MSTYGQSLRRGLPRTRGGEPWPPVGESPLEAAQVAEVEAPVAETFDDADETDDYTMPREAVAAMLAARKAAAAAVDEATLVEAVAEAPAAAAAPVPSSTPVRRGLPRVSGGEPWPPAGAPVPAQAAPTAQAAPAPAAAGVPTEAPVETVAPVAAPAASAPAVAPVAAAVVGDASVRRGLPRVAGGDPWPPADTRPVLSAAAEASFGDLEEDTIPRDAETEVARVEERNAEAAAASAPVVAVAPTGAVAHAARRDVSIPLPVPRSVVPGKYAFEHPAPREPKTVGALTRAEATGVAVIAGFGLIAAAFLVVTFTRWILSLEGPASFLQTYPGEYDLPEGAAPGFPAWARWQHFFNIFLMAMIIKSGWLVRTERRPEAFWTARWAKDQKRKISITLWFHQALDVLWLVNGIIFVVLLFASGHWMRIVPTSWEVFPNALSAILQYISLDWPTEHGWVNYNSIQQLMYFTVVFIAAPLAAITGVRMSGVWPKDAKTLNRIYPVEVARAIHFPVMLFFVLFILVHVALVFATGTLRNLNHMFAGTSLVNWAGFWIFVAAMAATAGAVFASRTLVIAPIAKLFGKVSQR